VFILDYLALMGTHLSRDVTKGGDCWPTLYGVMGLCIYFVLELSVHLCRLVAMWLHVCDCVFAIWVVWLGSFRLLLTPTLPMSVQLHLIQPHFTGSGTVCICSLTHTLVLKTHALVLQPFSWHKWVDWLLSSFLVIRHFQSEDVPVLKCHFHPWLKIAITVTFVILNTLIIHSFMLVDNWYRIFCIFCGCTPFLTLANWITAYLWMI